jgi:hypothetical protein
MAYVPRKTRRRKVRLGRLSILVGLVLALGTGLFLAVDYFFLREKPIVEIDDVLEELQPQLTRELTVITDPFELVNARAESIEIDGKTIDLVALYEDYEELYYLVEPMTEEEIINQFVEIYLWQKPIYQHMISRDPATEKRIDMFGNEYASDELYFKIMDEFARQVIDLAEDLNTTDDVALKRFGRSFVFDTIRTYYMYKEPKAVFMRMQDLDASISRYDRELYVRMFKTFALMHQRLYAKYGITYQCPLCPVESGA